MYLGSKSRSRLRDHWHDLVSDFSALSLTREDDVLPAIAGLAKEHQQHRGSRYFAGLWEDSFILDLMWTVKYSKRSTPRRWRAPSWSWASVNDSISYFELRRAQDFLVGFKVHCRVIEIQCTPILPGDETGELASGWARLSGIVAPIEGERMGTIFLHLRFCHLSKEHCTGQIYPETRDMTEDKIFRMIEDTFYLHLGSTRSTHIGLVLRRSEDKYYRTALVQLTRAELKGTIGDIEALGGRTTITVY